MKDLTVFTHKLGKLDNLVHILAHQDEAIFIDPAWDAQVLIDTVRENSLRPVAVLLTHSHYDHVDALLDILKAYPNLNVYITQIEAEHERFQKRFKTYFSAHPDKLFYIRDKQVLQIAGLSIDVIHTPGHTVGSVCFYTHHHLFAGDTLFINGIGRCDFEDSDVEKMFESLDKLRILPPETVVYSGHDYGITENDSLKHQFSNNPYFLIKDKAFFIDMRLHLQSKFHRIPFKPRTIDEVLEFKSKQ